MVHLCAPTMLPSYYAHSTTNVLDVQSEQASKGRKWKPTVAYKNSLQDPLFADPRFSGVFKSFITHVMWPVCAGGRARESGMGL